MRAGISFQLICFLASFIGALSALNISNEDGAEESNTKSDGSERAIEVVMIVIAAMIVTGMLVIIIAISCKLREKGTVSELNLAEEMAVISSALATPSSAPTQEQGTSRQWAEIQLPPVEEAALERTPDAPPLSELPATPEDMQMQPPPFRDFSYISDHASTSEMGYSASKGITLGDLTEYLPKKS